MKMSGLSLSSFKICFSWAHNHWQVPRQRLSGALCGVLKNFRSIRSPAVEGTEALGALVCPRAAGTAPAPGLVVTLPLLFSHVQLFVTPWTEAHQAPLSSTISPSLFNSCPLSRWCHPTILSSAAPFSFCLQSFPASGSFPMSWLFTSKCQATAHVSVTLVPKDS